MESLTEQKTTKQPLLIERKYYKKKAKKKVVKLRNVCTITSRKTVYISLNAIIYFDLENRKSMELLVGEKDNQIYLVFYTEKNNNEISFSSKKTNRNSVKIKNFLKKYNLSFEKKVFFKMKEVEKTAEKIVVRLVEKDY